MSSPSTTSTRDARVRAGAQQWRGAGGVLGGLGTRQRSRRWRLAFRAAPVVAVLILLPFVIGWMSDSHFKTPAQVARAAHDEVQRQVIARTGDYSTTIGKLGCVELSPGRGNCIATYRTSEHQADNLSVAVAYRLEHGSNDMNLAIKLP